MYVGAYEKYENDRLTSRKMYDDNGKLLSDSYYTYTMINGTLHHSIYTTEWSDRDNKLAPITIIRSFDAPVGTKPQTKSIIQRITYYDPDIMDVVDYPYYGNWYLYDKDGSTIQTLTGNGNVWLETSGIDYHAVNNMNGTVTVTYYYSKYDSNDFPKDWPTSYIGDPKTITVYPSDAKPNDFYDCGVVGEPISQQRWLPRRWMRKVDEHYYYYVYGYYYFPNYLSSDPAFTEIPVGETGPYEFTPL